MKKPNNNIDTKGLSPMPSPRRSARGKTAPSPRGKTAPSPMPSPSGYTRGKSAPREKGPQDLSETDS
jgi:hypothetical protein